MTTRHGRNAPGILRLLPEMLPLYPFRETASADKGRPPNIKRRSRRRETTRSDGDGAADGDGTPIVVPNEPLHAHRGDGRNGEEGFTLFFLVDSTNRQSLLAIPKVSAWFHHALMGTGGIVVGSSRVICIPNNPSPGDINLHDSTSDPIVQASINSSSSSSMARQQIIMPMLDGMGFYHLPFLHPKRLSLIHLLGATRVPSVIVVSNVTGRVVTRYGWEAIEREFVVLEGWIERCAMEAKKDGDVGFSSARFESRVVEEWRSGRSGLPLWWHLLSWFL